MTPYPRRIPTELQVVESLVGPGALGRLGAPTEGQRGVLRGTTCIGAYLATHGPMDVVLLPIGEPMRCTEVGGCLHTWRVIWCLSGVAYLRLFDVVHIMHSRNIEFQFVNM